MTEKILPAHPTAIVAANNFIAVGIGRYLHQKAVRVPQNISVVSFDDVPVSWNSEPFLTVAVQPAYEIGRCATELLLKRIQTKATDDFQEIVLPVEIIIRHSTGPVG